MEYDGHKVISNINHLLCYDRMGPQELLVCLVGSIWDNVKHIDSKEKIRSYKFLGKKIKNSKRIQYNVECN